MSGAGFEAAVEISICASAGQSLLEKDGRYKSEQYISKDGRTYVTSIHGAQNSSESRKFLTVVRLSDHINESCFLTEAYSN